MFRNVDREEEQFLESNRNSYQPNQGAPEFDINESMDNIEDTEEVMERTPFEARASTSSSPEATSDNVSFI